MRKLTPQFPFGLLNRISQPTIQDRVDPRTTSFLEAARKVAEDQYESDSLANRGSYRGVILKVFEPQQNPFISWVSELFAEGSKPHLWKVKARIPEIHLAIPEPSSYNLGPDDLGTHNHIIDMHPTFIAVTPLPYPPAVGDIALFDFEDRQNFAGPQLISIINGRHATPSDPFGVGGRDAFGRAGGCGGTSTSAARGDIIASQAGVQLGSSVVISFQNEDDIISNLNTAGNEVRNSLIRELIALGDASDNKNERIPQDLAFRIVEAGETGLLALFVGAANWGIRWSEGTNIPEDPSGNNWAGVRARSGKHVRDYAYGGVGIPHIDSSFLKRDTYNWAIEAGFGLPTGIPEEYLRDTAFNPMIDGPYADRWLPWAERLVYNDEFQIWSINTWMEKYWEPAASSNPTISQMAINSRIRNSVSGVGRRLAGQSAQQQVQGYYDYKFRDRGLSAAERSVRQSTYAFRVPAIVAAFAATQSTGEIVPPTTLEPQNNPADQIPVAAPVAVTNCVRSVGQFSQGADVSRLSTGQYAAYEGRSEEEIKCIVVHCTAGTQRSNPESVVENWIGNAQRERNPVSTHFTIMADGTIVGFWDDPIAYGAWHGGPFNKASIGIDLEGDPDNMTLEQFSALGDLVTSREFFRLPMLGHRHYSNKTCPNEPGPRPIDFPWHESPFLERCLPHVSAAALERSLDSGTSRNADRRQENPIRNERGSTVNQAWRDLMAIGDVLRSQDTSRVFSYRLLPNYYDGSVAYMAAAFIRR